MKVCLHQPTSLEMSLDSKIRVLQYGLEVLKAVTPKKYDIAIYSGKSTQLPEADVYGLSVNVSNASLATNLADVLRENGKIVIIGGPWAKSNTSIASSHASIVVVGEAENLWPSILEDVSNGSYQKVYLCESSDLVQFPSIQRPQKGLLNFSNILLTSRGCPNNCAFCDQHIYSGREIRTRPVDAVVDEVKQIESQSAGLFKNFLFLVDLNTIGDREYARELFSKMKGTRLKWMTSVCLNFGEDEELLELAYSAGCRAVFIGYETIEERNIPFVKPCSKNLDHVKLTKNIRKKGIMILGSFIFGFDHDTPDTFRKTLQFCLDSGIEIAEFNPLLALPGSRMYQHLLKEGRLTDEPRFLPRNFSYQEMVDITKSTHDEFYRMTNVLTRARKIRGASDLILYLYYTHHFSTTFRRSIMQESIIRQKHIVQ